MNGFFFRCGFALLLHGVSSCRSRVLEEFSPWWKETEALHQSSAWSSPLHSDKFLQQPVPDMCTLCSWDPKSLHILPVKLQCGLWAKELTAYRISKILPLLLHQAGAWACIYWKIQDVQSSRSSTASQLVWDKCVLYACACQMRILFCGSILFLLYI